MVLRISASGKDGDKDQKKKQPDVMAEREKYAYRRALESIGACRGHLGQLRALSDAQKQNSFGKKKKR